MKKVIILGSAGCGKSALVHRALTNTFLSDYRQTFGADLAVKLSSDSKKSNLQIWCCGGHERYRVLLEQFYLDADAAVLCFDMLSAPSLQELTFWYNEVKRNSPQAFIVVVGTKADEVDAAVVKAQDGMKQALEWNADFKAVSSKTGSNINELFDLIFDMVSKS